MQYKPIANILLIIALVCCGTKFGRTMATRKRSIMLGINDINLLKSQNEGLKKQNEELQKEDKQKSSLIGNLGYKIHNQRKEINQRLKQIETLNNKCEKYKQVLNNISDLVSKWYEDDIIQYQR